MLVRKQFFIGIEQVNFLRGLKTLSVSEHFRRAIDEYVQRIKDLAHPGTSPSYKKESD